MNLLHDPWFWLVVSNLIWLFVALTSLISNTRNWREENAYLASLERENRNLRMALHLQRKEKKSA